MQDQASQLAAQSSRIRDLEQRMSTLQSLTETMQTALAEVQGKNAAVAMR